MEFKINAEKKTLLVKLDGDIDHHNVKRVRTELDREIEKIGIKNIAFDFSSVRFMDSAGIGMIMGRYRRINAIGGKIYIIGANEDVKRIIGISGLGNIVEIYSDWSEIE